MLRKRQARLKGKSNSPQSLPIRIRAIRASSHHRNSGRTGTVTRGVNQAIHLYGLRCDDFLAIVAGKLTNILHDLAEDVRRQRLYLPRELNGIFAAKPSRVLAQPAFPDVYRDLRDCRLISLGDAPGRRDARGSSRPSSRASRGGRRKRRAKRTNNQEARSASDIDRTPHRGS